MTKLVHFYLNNSCSKNWIVQKFVYFWC